MRPDLTIAIPTYNRAEKLKDALDTVIKYSSGKNIEILVSDNASTDTTCEYVENIQKENLGIKYYRNNENLGFDGNFLNCFEKATGEYVWLLSDDDILLPGAIESVLACIARRPVCVHLNTSSLISDSPIKFGNPRYLDIGMQIYNDKNTFLKSIGIYCTFVSSLIFKVDYVRAIENKEQYFHTNILQSHIFFETMKNEGSYIVNTYNCIASRGNRTVNYDVFTTWIKGYGDLLLGTGQKCGFEPKTLANLFEVALNTTIYEFVLKFRLSCLNEFSWDRECIWQYIYHYPKLVHKYKIAVNCPKWYLRILDFTYRLKRKIKKYII